MKTLLRLAGSSVGHEDFIAHRPQQACKGERERTHSIVRGRALGSCQDMARVSVKEKVVVDQTCLREDEHH
ncbi:hypothetical protein ACOMHN_065481 [Nucella lapillus]